MKTLLFTLLIIISILGISFATQAQVTSIIDPSTDANYADGKYELNDFMRVAINTSNLVLRFVGSLALLMFIYGGFTFLLSAGSSEKVDKGKKILIAAVVGLVIIFTSFLIIKFALQTVGIKWDGQILSNQNLDLDKLFL